MAMLHGVLIGIAAIALIGIILISGKDKETGEIVDGEIPTLGPGPVDNTTTPSTDMKPLSLVARQHGVYSTLEAARTSIAEDSSLATAAVIYVDNNYYVWSAVGLSESEIMDSESVDSFRKSFIATTTACKVIGAGHIYDVLTTTESAKIKKSVTSETDEQVLEFNKNIDIITAFTNDMRVIRAHLLSHYSYNNACVKITF